MLHIILVVVLVVVLGAWALGNLGAIRGVAIAGTGWLLWIAAVILTLMIAFHL